MDFLRIFRMQEPISIAKESAKHSEAKEKENDATAIEKLKKEISGLKLENTQMEKKLTENEFYTIIQNYEELFKKVWLERENLVHQNMVLNKHVSNLEIAYYKIVEKFVRSKLTIEGLMENQNKLQKTLQIRKSLITDAENKFMELKEYLESKIEEANLDIIMKERDNIMEAAKLKDKYLHSQEKIDELENRIQAKDISQRQSIFAPLKNKLSKNN